MLKDKTVKIFDKDKISVGSFITVGQVSVGQNDGRYVAYKLNGIISYVEEGYFSFTMYDGAKKRIEVADILDDEIRILGMTEHVG